MFEKYNYSNYERAKLFQILKDNNVILQYESDEDVSNALNQILSLSLDSFKRNFIKYSYNNLYYQHDTGVQKISGYVKVFSYLNLMMFDDQLLKKIDEILESLRMYNNYPPIDIVEWFSIAYDSENKVKKYTFSTFCPFHDTELQNINSIFEKIKYDELPFHRKFRRNSEYCVLSRLIYGRMFSLKEIGYYISPSVFMEDIVVEKYNNYKGFYDFLHDKITTFKYMDVIFKTDDFDYISLEFAVEDVECLNDLVDCNLLNEEQKLYLINNKKTKEADNNFLLKIEWDDFENVKVLWYNKS